MKWHYVVAGSRAEARKVSKDVFEWCAFFETYGYGGSVFGYGFWVVLKVFVTLKEKHLESFVRCTKHSGHYSSKRQKRQKRQKHQNSQKHQKRQKNEMSQW